ncbi:SKP1-like protein 14 [Senna tora]|uniref:SKP1-like protein 14 n=1 Tax=Senna tora TaxID=362788 RepID=A0A834W0H9_9FABA|nr:SKP1-like protein 14 [Senna tora]
MCLDILSTVEALERRGMLIEDKCPWCNIENEIGYHVLVECDILKQIWDNAPFNFNGRSYHGSVLEWMVVEWSEWSRDQRGCFAMSLYYIWEARNGKKFRGENPNLHDIWRRVERSWDELITAEESTMSNQNQPPNLKWIKPTDPFIKLNVDIALKQDGVGAVGGVFRDHERLCVGAFSGKVPPMGDVTLMEALGMRKGIEVARDGGITHIIVESDSKLVVDMLHSPCTHESRLSAVCKSIIELCKQFSDCDIRWVPRVNVTYISSSIFLSETIMDSQFQPSSSKKIPMKTSDGVSFHVDAEVVMEMETLRTFIEDDSSRELTMIPLPNVTGDVLTKVIDYIKTHIEFKEKAKMYNNNNKRVDSGKYGTFTEEATSYDSNYLKNLDNYAILELLMAANYLNVKDLLDFLNQGIANRIKNKSVEYVRKFFGIENDFTPEEEQAIRLENSWVWEDIDED